MCVLFHQRIQLVQSFPLWEVVFTVACDNDDNDSDDDDDNNNTIINLFLNFEYKCI